MSQEVVARPRRRAPAAKLVSLDEYPHDVLNEVARQVARDPASRPVLFLDLGERAPAGDDQVAAEAAVQEAVERAVKWLDAAFAYKAKYRKAVQTARELADPGVGAELGNIPLPTMAVVEPTMSLWGADRAKLADAGGYIVRPSQEFSDARSLEEKEAALGRYLTP